MKKTINRLLPFLFAGMFVYTGCAKQGVVKSDDQLAPVVAKSAALGQKPVDKPIAAAAVNSSVHISNEQMKSQLNNESAASAALQKPLEKIFFDFDSASLNDSARQTLTRNFAVLKQNPQAKIRIEGNCDERGSDEYNLALGEQRSKAAAHYLTALGISAERLATISYGKEKPADPGHDENAWAKNRRDEFVITNR